MAGKHTPTDTPATTDDSFSTLRNIPDFCKFAKREMAADPEYWEREARFGVGILGAAAAAVVEIGGSDAP